MFHNTSENSEKENLNYINYINYDYLSKLFGLLQDNRIYLESPTIAMINYMVLGLTCARDECVDSIDEDC